MMPMMGEGMNPDMGPPRPRHFPPGEEKLRHVQIEIYLDS